MVASSLRCLIATAICTLACTAAAQTSPSTAQRADPLDAAANVPAVVYESVFGRRPRSEEAQAIPWREANDQVARIGGWRTYAREAQQPAPAAAIPAAPPPPPDAEALPPAQGQNGPMRP